MLWSHGRSSQGELCSPQTAVPVCDAVRPQFALIRGSIFGERISSDLNIEEHMVHSGIRPSTLCLGAATLLGCVALTGCNNSRVGTASPRISGIPLQSTTGQGAAFSVNLNTYVSDRENQALTYAVTSGGGSFSGSTYSNTFDTMGTYTVDFTVSDPGKSTTGSFQVVVQKANFAVVKAANTGLRLLDTDTEKFLDVSAAAVTETYKDSLAKGWVVFERTNNSNTDLFAYDPATRVTRTLGDSGTENELYVGKTSDNKVVFTNGTSTDTNLVIWNAVTNVTKSISGTVGEHDRNALINTNNIVFYERESGGQADIYYYDPAEDESYAVSTDSNAESLLAVMPDGAAVFSRIGSSGETDLYYFKIGTGLVEIGGGITGADAKSKTYNAYTSNNLVVFTLTTGATAKNIYFWNPSGGLSTAILAADADVTYRAITTTDVVVYTQVAASQDDIYCFDVVNGTPGTPVTISTNATGETVNTTVTDGSVAHVVYTRNGSPASVHVYNVTTTATTNLTNGAGIEYKSTLPGGDLAYRIADGTGVFHFDPATATSTSVTTGLTATAMDFVGQGTANGDFVITATTSSQTDLYLWDHSATSRVTVSDTTGNDVWRAMTTAGEVLFTRVISGNTTADLFIYDPADSTTVQLTGTSTSEPKQNHTVPGTFTADNS